MAELGTILFLISQTKNKSNGGVTSITNIIKQLQHVDRLIVTQRSGAFVESWTSSGASVMTVDNYLDAPLWRKLWLFIKLNVRIFKYCYGKKRLVLHANDIKALLFLGIGGWLAGSRIVFNIRDVKAPGERYGITWKIATSISSSIIVLSKEMGRELSTRLQVSENKIRAIYSIVDTDRFRKFNPAVKEGLKSKNDLNSSFFHVGIVAAFMKKKRQLELITKMLPLMASHPHIKFVFVGDAEKNDPYFGACLKALGKTNLDERVKLIGYRADVENWYNMFDVTLIASEREGLARCMIESIASGTPVISFDVTSASEILDGAACGIIVKRDDYDGLSNAILQLASNPSMVDKMSSNGRAFALANFQKEPISTSYLEIYRNVADVR